MQSNGEDRSGVNGSRRGFVKRAAYAAPAILTLQAAPSYVKAGSHHHCDGEAYTPDGMTTQEKAAWVREARKRAQDPDWNK